MLARQFGDALRLADGDLAEQVIEEAFALGLPPAVVQSTVIAPAMVRIGELWESGLLTVAEEHLATAISERALLRIFEALMTDPTARRTRERVVLAGVEGQQHVLGLRMVADVLEGAGFDVQNLGANVPVASLADFVACHEPAVVGLSFGIALDVGRLADSLAAIHAVRPETRIMLGGRAVPPALWHAGYPRVASTVDVVTTVEDLLAGPPQTLPAVVEILSGGPEDAIPQAPRPVDITAESFAKVAEHAADLARTHVRRSEGYRELAFHDSLTGLANRRAFEERMEAIRADTVGTLLMIDVDGFKAINDLHGHLVGDDALRAVARALEISVRPGDMTARLGGDEFAVLLPGATVDDARHVAERVRDAVRCSADPPINISVGVSPLMHDQRSTLLAADGALYEAKAAGRDRVVTREEGSPRSQSPPGWMTDVWPSAAHDRQDETSPAVA